MNWNPLNLTVRVGCHLTYETTVQTPVLFVLRPRLEGRVLVMQEKLSFDPRFNVPRIGRVKVAHGADAVDGAFATIYGEANLTHFQVWAYQVNPPACVCRRCH